MKQKIEYHGVMRENEHLEELGDAIHAYSKQASNDIQCGTVELYYKLLKAEAKLIDQNSIN